MTVAEIHAEAKRRYRDDKDLPAARRLLEEGIAYARRQGLTGEEKALQYDLAAFCWHGWDEPGIIITPEDSTAGARAAEENLRLAQELGRPAFPMSNAWWMVGAYRLQEGDFEGAVKAFESFRALTEGDRARELLAEGYLEIPRLYIEQTFDLGPVCGELRALGGDGPAYADQLETAFVALTRRWATEAMRRDRSVVIETVDPALEAEALGEVLRAAVLAGGSVHFLDTLTPEDAADYWRGVKGRTVLAARDETGRIVGTVSLILDSPPNQPHRAEVGKMIVHPDFRRRGIARALMETLHDLARREKRTLLTLDTVAGGEAEGLYRSMGYEFAGSIPDFAYLPDRSALVATNLYYRRL